MKDDIYAIVITGLPGAGKTVLGKKISHEFNIPLLSKDDYKEVLFDSLGYKDREWSRQIGHASYDILYHCAEVNFKAGTSAILEANFDPAFANDMINSLKAKYSFKTIQIRCFADGDALIKRFEERAVSGERHPGHRDQENIYEWQQKLSSGKIESLDIGTVKLDVNTTDFARLDDQVIFDWIRLHIE